MVHDEIMQDADARKSLGQMEDFPVKRQVIAKVIHHHIVCFEDGDIDRRGPCKVNRARKCLARFGRLAVPHIDGRMFRQFGDNGRACPADCALSRKRSEPGYLHRVKHPMT